MQGIVKLFNFVQVCTGPAGESLDELVLLLRIAKSGSLFGSVVGQLIVQNDIKQ